MAHTYSHLFGLPTPGLRFFTVYGPWGRPDMALFLFTKAILEDQPIKVFNNGNMPVPWKAKHFPPGLSCEMQSKFHREVRDFTYVNDTIEGVTRVIDNPPVGAQNKNAAQTFSSSQEEYPDRQRQGEVVSAAGDDHSRNVNLPEEKNKKTSN